MQASDSSGTGGAYRGSEGPAWRWKLALAAPSRSYLRTREHVDPLTRAAHAYVLLRRRDTAAAEEARRQYPEIAAAERLVEDPAQSDVLKLLTLAGCERTEIAARTALEARVVETWEQLFFDVRPMREAVGWIQTHVIRPEQDAGREAQAARLKLAWSLGPAGAQAVLDADTRFPVTAAQQHFDRSLKLHLKFQEAIALPLATPQDQMRFVKFYADLNLAERRLQLEERKLHARCIEAQRRHELAEMRREEARQRQERRAAKQAERVKRADRRMQQKREQALRREEEALLQQAQLGAEQRAARERAAASPLARLRWAAPAAAAAASQIPGTPGLAHDMVSDLAPNMTVPEETRQNAGADPEIVVAPETKACDMGNARERVKKRQAVETHQEAAVGVPEEVCISEEQERSPQTHEAPYYEADWAPEAWEEAAPASLLATSVVA